MNLLSVAGFTNLGAWWHARRHEPITNDLSDKSVVITGGTGGLGRAAAAELARLGARTIVVGRDPKKLRSVESEIAGEVVGYEADLSLMTQVRALANHLMAEEGRIDVLINNVGVLRPEREETTEGMEMTLATDLAGHFLPTNLLIPRLVACAPSRIVNVTSGGMYAAKIDPSDLQFRRRPYRGPAAYAQAKRGQVVLTGMWADRLRETGVSVHAMHPGWARTSGVEESLPVFNKLMGPFLRSPNQGADTIVWLAAAERPGLSSGHLWFDREIVSEHLTTRTVDTDEDRAHLWETLTELTGSDIVAGPRGT